MEEFSVRRLLDLFQAISRFTDKMPPLPPGVTPAYIKLIGKIHELSTRKEAVRISDLADELKLALPGITRSLKRMEGEGLVKKSQSQEDKRVFYISLTDEGRDIYAKFIEDYQAEIQDKLKSISSSELNSILDRMERVMQLLGEKDKSESK